MKLALFTPDNFQKRQTKTPQITITKSCIRLNPGVVAMMGLNASDKVALGQDEENPKDWYIAKVENGFKLSGKTSVDPALYFNCQALVDTFRKTFPKPEGKIQLPVGTVPTEVGGGVQVYALLTKAIDK